MFFKWPLTGLESHGGASEEIKGGVTTVEDERGPGLGPVSERRLSENSEYVNPEMRETLGFPFQNGRFVKPGKAG